MDNWIKRKIGLAQEEPLTRKALEDYQLEKLIDTVKIAKENGRFYRKHLQDIRPDELKCLEDFQKLPLMDVNDLRKQELELLCVRQNEISRIVTVDTSGSTGMPKRIYFTPEDQELTIDFFHHGMMYLVDKSDVVLILMPCKRPGSVGDLLNTALIRLGAKTVPYGLPDVEFKDLDQIQDIMVQEGVTSIVGVPTQANELVKASLIDQRRSEKIAAQMRSVLLSAEYVPESVCERIRDAWNCPIFEHYGMTEMGLGGAVSCGKSEGYHPREADIYFEVINPETEQAVPDGEYGELVFTTLTRKGMPFIRYRTGDWSRWLTGPCACGSTLKRLDKVGDRKITKGYLK